MLELDTILAPVDFSEHSRAAAEHAAALGRRFRSRLIFLHVVAPSPYQHLSFEGGHSPGESWPAEQELRPALQKKLYELVENIPPDLEIEKLLLRGEPARKIEEVVKEQEVKLIVMPTRGHGPFRRFILGSVTTKVLHDVSCPVFSGAHVKEIVPADPAPYKHVACAIDLEEYSEAVVRWAWGFSDAYQADLSVIHAVRYREETSIGELLRQARARIEQLLAAIGARGRIFVESSDVHRLVPAIIEQEKADLLVIGRSQKEGFLGRLRTHAYTLIREAPCPVISV